MNSSTSATGNQNKKAKKSNDPPTPSTIEQHQNEQLLSEIETLRKHILNCPNIPSTSNAVRAALSGLDSEIKRMERDERLRKKFSSKRTTTAEEDTVVVVDGVEKKKDDSILMEWQDVEDLQHSKKKSSSSPSPSHSTSCSTANEDDDASNNKNTAEVLVIPPPSPPEGDSPLGRELTSVAISSMASAKVRISSPLAALALALHGALRSDILSFRCTGIPEDVLSSNNNKKKNKKGGFAAPIRELPKGQFLPPKWDAHASMNSNDQNELPRVALRYRKDGLGNCILRVIACHSSDSEEDVEATIWFGPSSSAQEPGLELSVPLNRHVNIDGLNAALASSTSVLPSLHYKALSSLMTRFASTFDLGSVCEAAASALRIAPVLATGFLGDVPSVSGVGDAGKMNSGATPRSTEETSTPPPPHHHHHPTIPQVDPTSANPGRGPNIDDITAIHPQGGDFDHDLAPGGIIDPRFSSNRNGNGLGGGNLMGPNHPSFHANPEDDDYNGFGLGGRPLPPGVGRGGLGMQPRFDPVHPPGLGGGSSSNTNPFFGGQGRRLGGAGRGRGRGSRFPPAAGPNHDHQRPPSDFGDMYM